MTDNTGQQAYLTGFGEHIRLSLFHNVIISASCWLVEYSHYLPSSSSPFFPSLPSSIPLWGYCTRLFIFFLFLHDDPPFFHSWGICDGYHSVIYWTTLIAYHSHKISDFRRLFFFFFHRQINSGQYILVMILFSFFPTFLFIQDGFIKMWR